MLAEVPRIPTFPEYMILKQIQRIERDVQDDVIPVSTGIYSQHKLMQKLQAIPKPETVNYQDPIFYQIVDVSKYPCKVNQCPLCREEFGNKKNVATQCYFCGGWNCSECICPRKRYHPRAKESNSERYSICYKCDDKFLNLTLNHGYMQGKALLEQILKRVRKQKDELQTECEKIEKAAGEVKEHSNRNKFKISSMKKEQVDFKKIISKSNSLKEAEQLKFNVKQKYLSMLMRKKQALQRKAQQQKEDQSTIQIQSPKTVRMLSQSHAYSQNINISALNNENDNFVLVKTQQNITVAEDKPRPQPQQKVENFYNYQEWGAQHRQKERQQIEQQVEIIDTPISQLKRLQPQIRSSDELALQTSDVQQYHNNAYPLQDDPQQYSQDDAQSVQSLDPQVIKTRKAALMKQAINKSQNRFQITDRSFSESEPNKCSCQIY